MWRRVAMCKRLYDFLLTRFDGAVYYDRFLRNVDIQQKGNDRGAAHRRPPQFPALRPPGEAARGYPSGEMSISRYLVPEEIITSDAFTIDATSGAVEPLFWNYIVVRDAGALIGGTREMKQYRRLSEKMETQVRAISYTVHGLIPASCVFADRYNREEVVRSLGKEVNINPPLMLGQLPDTPEELLKLDQRDVFADPAASAAAPARPRSNIQSGRRRSRPITGRDIAP
ncbi:hypothetical protein EVAR_88157_1 [Eumeta japonica]|uniref:Uncharacterized protein n=1 Tax=Eumeta variegata TaxID=151549 RepID=A0A4C1WBE3_EUMVA|nr:hypothetical protein EVAR_88157_1 [Eumeta japonica]